MLNFIEHIPFLSLASGGLSQGEVVRLLLALAALLGLSRLLGEIARMLKQPSVLGEIIAGVLLGPTILGQALPDMQLWLFPTEGHLFIAEGSAITLSAAMLLLVVGLEVDLSSVWRQGKAMLLVSLVGVIAPFGLGFAAATGFPDVLLGTENGIAEGFSLAGKKLPFRIFLGIALSITALPVIAKILMDLKLAKSDMGMLVIASAMLNDLIGWIGFAIVLALLAQASTHTGIDAGHVAEATSHAAAATPPSLWITIGSAIGFLVLMMTVGRLIAHRTLPWIQSRWSYPGGVLAAVFTFALLCAALTEQLGIHSIFGAFIAGVVVGDSHHLREKTRETIHQFISNIFAPIFFASIGLHINFIDGFDIVTVAIVLGIALIGKAGGSWLGAKLAGLSKRESWAVGFGMSAQGAMGIILGQLALNKELITEQLMVAIVVMALTTSILAGPLMQKILNIKPKKQLHEILGDKHILVNPSGQGTQGIFHAFAKRAEDLTGMQRRIISHALWEREQQMSTGMPGGMAVPHARLGGLEKPLVLLAISRLGIDFNAPDGEPAHLICMILTPIDKPESQLEMLRLFGETFANKRTKDMCLAATSAMELRAALNQIASEEEHHVVPHDNETLGVKS